MPQIDINPMVVVTTGGGLCWLILGMVFSYLDKRDSLFTGVLGSLSNNIKDLTDVLSATKEQDAASIEVLRSLSGDIKEIKMRKVR